VNRDLIWLASVKVEDSEIGWSRFNGFVGVMDWVCVGKGSQNYSVDGHGDSMYFRAFVKYQNIGLSLANSSILEYLGYLPYFVAAAAAWPYLLAWRNWSVEVSIVLFSTYISSMRDRRSRSTSISGLLEQGGR
jgi:hypothetical protein